MTQQEFMRYIGGPIFEVQYKGQFREVLCMCKLFEVTGTHTPSRKQENQFSIDEKYILDRWRKDKNRLGLMLAGSSNSNTAEHNRSNLGFTDFICEVYRLHLFFA